MNNQLEDYSQTETAKYFGWLINIIIKSINIIAHIVLTINTNAINSSRLDGACALQLQQTSPDYLEVIVI